MSDNIQHIDVDSDEFEGTPKALREHVKKLQKALEARDATIGQFKEQVIGSVLGDAGFKNPSRVKKDLLGDGIDPLDADAVKAWIAENGDDYARSAPNSDTEQEQPGAAADEVAAQEKLNFGERAGQKAGGMTPLDKALAEITPDMDGAAVAAIFAKHGV